MRKTHGQGVNCFCTNVMHLWHVSYGVCDYMCVHRQKSKSIDTDIDIPLQQCNLELDLVSTSRPALCVYAECISGGGHETSGHNVETKVITPCMHKEVDKH